MSRAARIAGIGYTAFSRRSGRSTLELAIEAAQMAISDSGLPKSAIDGVVTFAMGDSVPSGDLAGYLGLEDVSVLIDLSGGGDLACASIGLAAAAVERGSARAVLVFRSLNGRSGRRIGGVGAAIDRSGIRQYMAPAGLLAFGHHMALWARRHMERYGTTREQFGHVAVKTRANALMNERAQLRDPLSLDEYSNAEIIADPLRIFDFCLESDGACAVLVVGADLTSDTRSRSVEIAAKGQSLTDHAGIGVEDCFDIVDLSSNFGFRLGPRLYGASGTRPTDLDLALIYDPFTPGVILSLESFGLASPGEGGAYVEDPQTLVLGGRLPVNTHGGLLSEGYIHGMNHVIEAVEQLRGDSGARQVDGAKLALVTSGAMTRGSGLILARG